MTSSTTVLASLGAAVILVVLFWKQTGHVITIVHEAGHTLLALLTGGWVTNVHINPKGGGTTGIAASKFWPFDMVRALGGYLAPPLAGLLLAYAADGRWTPRTVIIGILVGLGVMILLHGNWFGFLIMAALAGAAVLLLTNASATAQLGAIMLSAWTLLLGGLRDTIELSGLKQAGSGSDAEALGKITSIHASVWVVVFLTVAGACFVTGARMLLY